MTQYFEDFSGYTAGDDPTVDGPAGWTERWHTGDGSLSIVSNGAAPSGKAMRLTMSTFSRYMATYDAVDADASRDEIEVRVLANVGVLGSGNNVLWAAGRASGSNTTETAYVGNISEDASVNKGRLTIYDNGSVPTASFISGTACADNATVWLKLRCSGTSITVSVAPEGTPNTDTVTQTFTNSAISGTGWAGTGAFSVGGGTGSIDILAIGFGTNGDAAPTASISDVTAPILSSPTGTATGSTTATGTVSTDEGNGTLDAVVTTSATTPSAAQIQAGQDHTGAAAVATDLNNTVTTTGAQNVSFTGLTASTTYYVHYVHEDAATNVSTAVSSASFATSAAVAEGVSFRLYSGATPQASLTGIHYLWWDTTDPSGAPVASGTTEATDANGDIVIDLSASTALAVGGKGFLLLWKPDATVDADSLVFAGRVTLVDVA